MRLYYIWAVLYKRKMWTQFMQIINEAIVVRISFFPRLISFSRFCSYAYYLSYVNLSWNCSDDPVSWGLAIRFIFFAQFNYREEWNELVARMRTRMKMRMGTRETETNVDLKSFMKSTLTMSFPASQTWASIYISASNTLAPSIIMILPVHYLYTSPTTDSFLIFQFICTHFPF